MQQIKSHFVIDFSQAMHLQADYECKHNKVVGGGNRIWNNDAEIDYEKNKLWLEELALGRNYVWAGNFLALVMKNFRFLNNRTKNFLSSEQ